MLPHYIKQIFKSRIYILKICKKTSITVIENDIFIIFKLLLILYSFIFNHRISQNRKSDCSGKPFKFCLKETLKSVFVQYKSLYFPFLDMKIKYWTHTMETNEDISLNTFSVEFTFALVSTKVFPATKHEQKLLWVQGQLTRWNRLMQN